MSWSSDKIVEHTVLIAGDLNLPNVDWESFSAPRDKIQHPISNFMQAEGFIQYVNQRLVTTEF